jgi:ribose transport system substrate-binding protein
MKRMALIAGLLFSVAVAGVSNAESLSATRSMVTIGVSLLATNSPFFVEMGKSMADEAAKQGATVILRSADLNMMKQKPQVAEFIKKPVSAIVLCPVDSKAIGISIDEASTASIPVFTADIAAISGQDKVICHVATDNLAGGREAGEAMIQALGGGGKVAILDHRRSNR